MMNRIGNEKKYYMKGYGRVVFISALIARKCDVR